MSQRLHQHLAFLRKLTLGFAAGLLVGGGVASVAAPEALLHPSQSRALVWGAGAAALLNLLTLTPVTLALMGPAVRAATVSRDLVPLLQVHRTAFILALARIELGGLLGLVLFFITGNRNVFWAFAIPSLLAFAALWPRPQATATSLGYHPELFESGSAEPGGGHGGGA